MSSNILFWGGFLGCRENGLTDFGLKFPTPFSRISARGPPCPPLSPNVFNHPTQENSDAS